jgi:transposase
MNPAGLEHYQVEHFSMDGAVEPTTGASVVLECPPLNTANVQIVRQAFAPAYQETRPMVRRAHGRGHQAKALGLPAHGVGLFLPPYSPERTPIARLGRELKDRLAGVLATPRAELERHVETIIRQ